MIYNLLYNNLFSKTLDQGFPGGSKSLKIKEVSNKISIYLIFSYYTYFVIDLISLFLI